MDDQTPEEIKSETSIPNCPICKSSERVELLREIPTHTDADYATLKEWFCATCLRPFNQVLNVEKRDADEIVALDKTIIVKGLSRLQRKGDQ